MDPKPHPFSLRQLQYVVAVADALSFRRAAERCHVSQPSLSAQLAQVERALDVRIFERDKKRVLVTPAGQALVAQARALLLAADDLVSHARGAADPLTGTLRLGVIPTISPYLLPLASAALRKQLARLTIAWTEDKTPALAKALAAGTLDGAVVALESELGEVEHAEIARDRFVLVAPPDHPLGARATRVSPRDLAGAGVLLLDDGHCFREQALALCGSANAKELEFRATSLSTLVQMVAGGAGVTLLPALAVDTELRRAKLRVREFRETAPHRTLALVWRKRSPVVPALRAVAAVLRAAYRGPVSGRQSARRKS